MAIRVLARIADKDDEVIAVVDFNSIRTLTGALEDAVHRMTREMDYSTAYWKYVTITLVQEG